MRSDDLGIGAFAAMRHMQETGECPYSDREIGQILTGFSVSIFKAIKEIPGFVEGKFDRDAIFQDLIQKESNI